MGEFSTPSYREHNRPIWHLHPGVENPQAAIQREQLQRKSFSVAKAGHLACLPAAHVPSPHWRHPTTTEGLGGWTLFAQNLPAAEEEEKQDLGLKQQVHGKTEF